MSWRNLKLNSKYANWLLETEDSEINVLEGSVRSGKTTIMVLAFCMYLETLDYPTLNLAAAENLANAKAILFDGGGGFGIKDWFSRSNVIEKQYKGRDALYINIDGIQHIVVGVGSGLSSSYRSIRGLTIDSVILTELDLAHTTFISEVLDRTLTSKKRKLFFDLNPTHFQKPVYTDFLDRWAEGAATGELLIKFNHIRIVMPDNPVFTEEDIERIKSQYDPQSNDFKSLILGERINMSGMIYSVRDYNIIEGRPDFVEYVVLVDVGVSSSATTFITMGMTKERKLVISNYYYHKNGAKSVGNKVKEYDDYARDLAQYVLNEIEDLGAYPRYVFIDRDISFLRATHRIFPEFQLNRNLVNYAIKEKIETRISATRNLLYHAKLLFVGQKVDEVVEAFRNVVYDPKKFEKGELVRLDDTSLQWNPVDLIDPSEYGVSYFTSKYNI